MHSETQKKLVVLIVDDDAQDQSMFRLLLQKVNPEVTVLEADNVSQGFDLYTSEKPDCVLLDYRFPVLNGFWFLKRLIGDYGDLIPIIILTGQGNESLAVEAMKIGAQDYLVKNKITPASLYRAVINAIEKVRLKRTIEEQQKKMLRSKQEFEHIAHVAFNDLREPLKDIAALCERLEAKYTNIPGHDEICQINKKVARMHKLIYNLSTLSHMESIQRPFTRVNLSDIATSAISNLQSHITEFDGDIKTANLPVIDADTSQMYQLFHHLISFELILHNMKNPLILTIDGMVIENQNQKPRKSSKTKLCQITLEDKSSRIARKHLKNLFTPSLSRGNTGYRSSIDLVLCRRIVERHKGKIFAENIPHKGIKFTIQLPLKQPKAGEVNDGYVKTPSVNC